MGATTKPPGARSRRNKGQADWVPIEDAGDIPVWPGSADDPAEARDYWATVWAELGGMWSPADRMPLYRAAVLHSSVVSSARKKGLAKTLSRISRKVTKLVEQESGDFTKADSEFLAKLAIDFALGPADSASAKELRDLEDRLGISPLSRRRLQWELKKGTGKGPRDAAPKTDAKAQSRTTGTGNVLTALEG